MFERASRTGSGRISPMNTCNRYAILLDGAFVIKKLQSRKKQFPSADDIESLCIDIQKNQILQHLDLLRIYFYHARPAKEVLTNPIDRQQIKLGDTVIYSNHERLLDTLELKPDFAVRLGEIVVREWSLGASAVKSLMKSPRSVLPSDLVPNINQKGVDLRIGLDIARLSLKEMVHAIVVVTGDSDLVPAFKFARREGVRIYLNALGHGIRRELKVHADRIL